MNPVALLAVASALSLAACAAPADPASPAAAPASPAGHWACLTAPSSTGEAIAQPASAAVGDVAFDVSLAEAFTHAPVGGLDLALCARNDALCAAPLSHAQADPLGVATLEAPGDPAAFDGFIRVSGPGLATHYVFLLHRVPAYGSTALAIELYTPAALATASATSGIAVDPGQAVVRVDAHDCADQAAAAVAVTVGATGEGEPAVAYLGDDGESLGRLGASTDGSGVAVGLDIPEGVIGAADRLDGQAAGGTLAFTVAGAVSEVVVRP